MRRIGRNLERIHWLKGVVTLSGNLQCVNSELKDQLCVESWTRSPAWSLRWRGSHPQACSHYVWICTSVVNFNGVWKYLGSGSGLVLRRGLVPTTRTCEGRYGGRWQRTIRFG